MKIREIKQGRNVFSNLCSGRGAEIGVEEGKFSEVLLESCDEIFLVDLWKNYEGYREHVDDAKYEAIFEACKKRLKRFGDRVKYIRTSSVEASKLFLDDYLDWIYVDANHRFESVLQDLESWYPKVKSGGIISGHDYKNTKDFGVIKAVHEFCEKKGIEEICVWTLDKSPSYHFIKP